MSARADDDPWLAERAPPRKLPVKWIVAGASCCLLPPFALFLALLAAGAAMESGCIPDSKAVAGAQVSERMRGRLAERGLLQPDEALAYFYSGAVLDVASEGCFVTDRRVVRYAENDAGELEIEEIALADAISVSTEFEEESMGDSWIFVESVDFESVVLEVCNDEEGDHAFDSALRAKWIAARRRELPEILEDGRVALEDQLATLRDLGIVPRDGDALTLPGASERRYFQSEPYERVLIELGGERDDGTPRSADAWLFGYDVEASAEELVRVAERMRGLADGALPLERP